MRENIILQPARRPGSDSASRPWQTCWKGCERLPAMRAMPSASCLICAASSAGVRSLSTSLSRRGTEV